MYLLCYFLLHQPDEDLFNPDYVEVDRILEVAHTKDSDTGEVDAVFDCSLQFTVLQFYGWSSGGQEKGLVSEAQGCRISHHLCEMVSRVLQYGHCRNLSS